MDHGPEVLGQPSAASAKTSYQASSLMRRNGAYRSPRVRRPRRPRRPPSAYVHRLFRGTCLHYFPGVGRRGDSYRTCRRRAPSTPPSSTGASDDSTGLRVRRLVRRLESHRSFTTIDLIAATTGALNGALLARRPSHYRNYTIVGVLLMAVLGGISGSATRDLLVNEVPPP